MHKPNQQTVVPPRYRHAPVELQGQLVATATVVIVVEYLYGTPCAVLTCSSLCVHPDWAGLLHVTDNVIEAVCIQHLLLKTSAIPSTFIVLPAQPLHRHKLQHHLILITLYALADQLLLQQLLDRDEVW